MKNKTLKNLTLAALFCALIFLAVFFAKIPLPFGYAHLGDAIMFLSALFLPLHYCIGAGAIGSVIADIAGGYGIYAPFTFIAKALSVSVFFLFSKSRKVFFRYILPCVLAAAVNAGIYFLSDYILYGISGAYASLPGNLMQGAASIIIYCLTAVILNKKINYHR